MSMSSINNKSLKSTVVVIGAGVSGLSAAKVLHDSKECLFNVIVLEAQDRVGGRVRSDRSTICLQKPLKCDDEVNSGSNGSGYVFDEGASWIHGIKHNPIAILAKEAGMTTIPILDEKRNVIVYDYDGTKYDMKEYVKAENKLFDQILPKMYKKGSHDKSFEELFQEQYPKYILDSGGNVKTHQKQVHRLWQFMLSAFVTFDCGELDDLSSKNYWEGENYDGIETFATNGYDTITTYLATKLLEHQKVEKGEEDRQKGSTIILLNHEVTKVDYTEKRVQVHYHDTGLKNAEHDHIEKKNSILNADYVIVTVPLGVLKSGSIKFTPDLPFEKRVAIDKIGMNCVNKFFLLFENVFWDKNVHYIYYTPFVKNKYTYFVNVNKIEPNTKALLTFAYADAARKSEQQTDDEIIEEIMIHLKSMYGSNKVSYPTRMIRTKWYSNPYSIGSYSYTAVGTRIHHFSDMATPVQSKVYFAGEHTHDDFYSTVSGAYLSGIQQARSIISNNRSKQPKEQKENDED